MLYQDKLILIDDNDLILKSYSFPFLTAKIINFNMIERIEVKRPSLTTGKYRIWGSGDFRTWFPFDAKRSTRDKIFIIYLHNKWRKIGFTVEESGKVLEILNSKAITVLHDYNLIK